MWSWKEENQDSYLLLVSLEGSSCFVTCGIPVHLLLIVTGSRRTVYEVWLGVSDKIQKAGGRPHSNRCVVAWSRAPLVPGIGWPFLSVSKFTCEIVASRIPGGVKPTVCGGAPVKQSVQCAGSSLYIVQAGALAMLLLQSGGALAMAC